MANNDEYTDEYNDEYLYRVFLSVSIFGRGYHSRYQNFEFTALHTLRIALMNFRNPVCTAFHVNVVWYILVKLAEISHYVLKNIRLTARLKPS